MTKMRRTKRWLASLGFLVCVGVALDAAADYPCGPAEPSCSFAYCFCTPIWNDCVATTGDWIACQALLEQCLGLNGCGTLP